MAGGLNLNVKDKTVKLIKTVETIFYLKVRKDFLRHQKHKTSGGKLIDLTKTALQDCLAVTYKVNHMISI